MATQAERVTTFAFHINGWKQDVLRKFFPDRKFVFPPFHLSDDVFFEKWAPRIADSLGSEVFVWSENISDAAYAFLVERSVPCYFVEDGFLRSNRPNAARTPPLSLTLDRQRPFFDSRGPSDFELLLESADFAPDAALMERSKAAIDTLVTHRLSKYNSVSELTLDGVLGPKTRPRVMVIGQVEDDASIKFGCDRLITNNDLVRLAAQENPQAQIIYKPHPDVLNGMRAAQSDPAEVEHLCHVLRENIPLAQSFCAIDKAYAITSLGGFEALLRNIPLTVVGCPFYAGWGLTDDRQPNPRRTHRRSLEEVFAAAYLVYPTYFDPNTGARITFEDAVAWLQERLANPDKYAYEFEPFIPVKWKAWGPYGVLGWRHLLTPIVAPIVGLIGNKRDVRNFRTNPIEFFRRLKSQRLRLLGRILYPFG
jgi:capsular polysaccharide export protein